MKRLLCICVTLVLLMSLLSVPQAQAAGDFIVDNGVLTRYAGTAKNVSIPDGVTVIGESAFEANSELLSVSLPASVSVIEDRAFCDCTSLSAVNGGENISRIGVHSFRGTPYLNSNTEKYMMLGKVLLWYNGSSESVTIPPSCEAIAPYAFMRCDTLRSFRAEGNLVEIGTGAFYDCANLSSVSVPSSVTEVGAYAFDGTLFQSSLGAFVVIGDGVLVKYQGFDADVVVPAGVRRVASAAFYGLSKLNSVKLPQGVYSIDPYAFADCIGLRSINFPEGLMNIGDGAFSGCRSLGMLLTPSTLHYIGQHAFNGTDALVGAHLCGSGLAVSYNAFKSSGLHYVLLSRGVGALYDGAFANCVGLTGVSISSGTSVIGTRSFFGSSRVSVSCSDHSRAASVLSASRSGAVKGDTDGDGEMSVVDATLIQRYLALMIPFNGLQMACADIDYDADIAVTDATLVQMILAESVSAPE